MSTEDGKRPKFQGHRRYCFCWLCTNGKSKRQLLRDKALRDDLRAEKDSADRGNR